MISDLYWRLFLNDGSAYYYTKYTEAIKKEGKDLYESRPFYCGCVSDKGTTGR